jgi:hypothetical protein
MSASGSLASISTQYHIAEYTSLHGEIRELNTEARMLERQVLYATGAVWTWLAIHGADTPWIAWYIPVLFVVGGAYRASSLKKAVDNIVSYILQLDKVFAASPNLIGWETYRREYNVTAGVMRSAKVFWWLLFALTILFPSIVMYFK